MKINKIHNMDCLEGMKQLQSNSIDLMVTDPPYGLSFMGKDWDKAVPSVEIWKECFRVLKDGAFAFIMSSPRLDVLSQMVIRLEKAGFRINFTPIYFTYASGFPKALNVHKGLYKRYEKTKSQMQDLWKTKIHQTKILPENKEFDGGIVSEMLEDLEQGKQHKIFTYAPGEIKGVQVSERQRQSCMERWGNIQKSKGQLHWCEICALPAGIQINGKKKWLCVRTSVGNGEITWTVVEEDGSSASFKSQGGGQPIGKFEVICEQCRTQKVGALSGAYAGFQPKPAVEVIIVAMKPLSEKTYVEQALKNGKGVTWLDGCRVPYKSEIDKIAGQSERSSKRIGNNQVNVSGNRDERGHITGRFPANLLVSGDVLNDGKVSKSTGGSGERSMGALGDSVYGKYEKSHGSHAGGLGDSGSFSRYFSLDAWWRGLIKKLPKDVQKVFPFLIVPKASKGEKNRGLETFKEKQVTDGCIRADPETGRMYQANTVLRKNYHPTVKPLQLISYLITLGSQKNDIVLDPFIGSGTTAISARITTRKFIGFEISEEYHKIALARLKPWVEQQKLEVGK